MYVRDLLLIPEGNISYFPAEEAAALSRWGHAGLPLKRVFGDILLSLL